MGQSGDAAELLTRLARGSANVLVTGRPGSGKSTLLRSLALDPGLRRFRFYFDLGLKPKDEPFPEYAACVLAPAMGPEPARAYDLFLYLIRSGTALCVLNAVDESVEEPSPEGFLRLFTDLSRWDHPVQPSHITHRPWSDRLKNPDYYENPHYADHTAVCVNWWSAYAFAAFEGKRLPTALEWEAATRGRDGRLFPWGDAPDAGRVNCADSMRAGQTSSKGVCRKRGGSNAVGFRCVQDIDTDGDKEATA